ncbi:hypothetical protein [Pseudomonas sp. NPDC007930]|uniref:hypothetical protein n=1 Tax=Pseudomonas sp. NPDC007930 TaxID=3364417 RepID=UPI0036E81756
MPFPTLGRDYIQWFCAEVELPVALVPDEVFALFEACGHRPELLGAAADEIRFDMTLAPEEVPSRFEALVKAQAAEFAGNLRKVIHSLTPIQGAVLRVLAAKGDDYAPFEAQTQALYGRAMESAGAAAADAKTDISGIQQALLALQDKKLVWKASRGVYAVDEQVIVDLLRQDGLLDGL